MTSSSVYISAPPVNSEQYRQEITAYFESLYDEFLNDEADLYDPLTDQEPHLVRMTDGMDGDRPF